MDHFQNKQKSKTTNEYSQNMLQIIVKPRDQAKKR
jgi:hypothetical protein